MNFFTFQKIVERFHRNIAVPADEDVAERIFLISEDKIQLTFHHQDGKITASFREFIKPPNANDKGAILTYTPEMTSTFQVDPHKKPAKNLYLYNLLVDLVSHEEKSVHNVRDSEEEVKKPLLFWLRMFLSEFFSRRTLVIFHINNFIGNNVTGLCSCK